MQDNDARLAVDITELATRIDAPTTDVPDSLKDADRFARIARVATELEVQALLAAHNDGVSWSRIGKHLGVSRQAVQQRVDPNYRPAPELPPTSRMLGPVDRNDEVEQLNAAGLQGWKPVKSEHGRHIMIKTDVKWEIQRVSIARLTAMPSAEAGWEAATTRFPDCFYVREI
ncbi:hypothetical protein [Corynebacterium sanguinis]|uniref:hypothetical protein n=1 Tax=Corynebacterium sanguinis TaxID=2594913 RepID=UPI001186220B|nr:hypothetical protein [Corynebacterium sanguinis]QDR76742.1 hypothetical protein E3227_00745 [Corynebacterium sanguinis]